MNDESIAAALEPVRRALLDDARGEAGRIVAEAESDAERARRNALAERDDVVDRERRAAARTAEAEAARAVDDAERSAHVAVLHARDTVRELFLRRLHDAVERLPDDERYPELRERLAELARSQLGPATSIEDSPDGGVVGTSSGRRVDYGLRSLADRVVASLPDEVLPWL